MLSISNINSAQASSYYKKDGYYARLDDKDNVWQGKLKDELFLPDNVTQKDFDALVKEREERAGFDLCFSAPKSVSVAMCLSEETRLDMIKAHEAAVSAVLQKIEEREVGARVTNNKKTTFVLTGNMICGKFNHYVSRASDPQLHTHAVILNKTAFEGKYYAIDNRNLYKNKMLYGQIYRNCLAAELMKKGYEISVTNTAKGFFELDGIQNNILIEFSKRRQQIVSFLKENAVESPEQAAKAAMMTRQAKENHDLQLLMKSWKETINELGGTSLSKSSESIIRTEQQIQEAFVKAIRKISRQSFAFAQKDLKKAVLAFGVGNGLSEEEGDRLIREDIGTKERLVYLGKPVTGKNDNEYYTTKGNIETEKIIHQAITTSPPMPILSQQAATEQINAIIKRGESLFPEQQKAIENIVSTVNQFYGIQGLAGTGKSHMLKYAREILEQNGWTVKGACPTGRAANELQDKTNISCETIHRHLNALEKQAGTFDPNQDLREKDSWSFEGLPKALKPEVWIVDEAGMVDNQAMKGLIEAARLREAKVVFVGDDKQLKPVSAGDAFSDLVKHGQMQYSSLTNIIRQKKESLLESVKEAVSGDIHKSWEKLSDQTHEILSTKKRISSIVKEYVALPTEKQSSTIILTAANQDRRTINTDIRAALKKKDLLKEGELINVSDADGHQSVKEFSVGDKVVFLQNNSTLKIDNGQCGIVQKNEQGLLSVQTDNKTITINTNEYNYIDHAYALTTHKAQGITTDKVIINLDSSQKALNNRNAYYVDISRAKFDVSIYTDSKTAIMTQIKDFSQKLSSRDFHIKQDLSAALPQKRNLSQQLMTELQKRPLLQDLHAKAKEFNMPRKKKEIEKEQPPTIKM